MSYHDSFTAYLRQITFELRDLLDTRPGFVTAAHTTLPGKDGPVTVRYIRDQGLEVETAAGTLRIPDEAWDQVGLVPADDAAASERVTPHDHRTYVPGCYRCELSRDEALAIARECSACHGEGAIGAGYSMLAIDPSDAMTCPTCDGSGEETP